MEDLSFTMSQLRAAERKQLDSWLGFRANFDLIYSTQKNDPTPAAFHQRCDGKGRLLTVAYNSKGYVFGGYFSVPCASTGDWVVDPQAFVFRLQSPNNATGPKLFANQGGTGCVKMNAENGPAFGGKVAKADNWALLTLTGTPALQGRSFPSGGQVTPSTFYNILKGDVADIAGADFLYQNLEVYMVSESALLPYEGPWRQFEKPWTTETRNELKETVNQWKSLFPHVVPWTRALLVGPVGAGKSSLINTVKSIFYGYPTNQAATGTTSHSLTTEFRAYTFREGRRGNALPFKFCDTMGLEDGRGIDEADVPYILDGNIPDEYKFSIDTRITPDIAGFKQHPKLLDKIHVVVLIIDCTTFNIMTDAMRQKIQSIRNRVIHRAIPLMVLLTKVDQVCPNIQQDLSNVFHSRQVADKLDDVAGKLGLPRKEIYPVKNYEHESSLDFKVDILVLMALQHMLHLADDFLDEQEDRGQIRGHKLHHGNNSNNNKSMHED